MTSNSSRLLELKRKPKQHWLSSARWSVVWLLTAREIEMHTTMAARQVTERRLLLPDFAFALLFCMLTLLSSAESLQTSLTILKKVNRKGPYVGLITVYPPEEDAFFATGAFKPHQKHPYVDLSGRIDDWSIDILLWLLRKWSRFLLFSCRQAFPSREDRRKESHLCEMRCWNGRLHISSSLGNSAWSD